MTNKKADVVKFDIKNEVKTSKVVDLDKKKHTVTWLKIACVLKWVLVGVLTALGAVFAA